MKKETSDRLQYAKLLLSRGMNIDEVLKDSVFSDLNPSTRRSWKKRLSATLATPKNGKVETLATQNETGATPGISVQHSEETTKTPEKTQVEPGFLANCVSNFHPADLIYYGCLFIACNAITGALHGIGYAVAVIVAAVSFVALQGVKSETGWRRGGHIALLAFFEVVFFALHWWWANNALWSNVAGLPFDIWANKYRDSTGELVHLYGGSDLDKPFLVAVGVAVIMLVCTVYVVWISIQAAKERTKNTPTNAAT